MKRGKGSNAIFHVTLERIKCNTVSFGKQHHVILAHAILSVLASNIT